MKGLDEIFESNSEAIPNDMELLSGMWVGKMVMSKSDFEKASKIYAHQAIDDCAKLQADLRCDHFDNPDEEEIVHQGILSLKEKY